MTKEEIVKELRKVLNAVDITFPYRLELINAIEYLLKPSLPSNLDEAAEEATGEYVYNEGGPFPHTTGVSFFNGFKVGAEWMARQGFLRWRNINEEKPERGECCACITVTVDGHIKYSNFEEGPWYWNDKIDSNWFGTTEAFIGHNDYGDKEYHTCSYWMPWDEFMGVLERQFQKYTL